MTKFFAILSIIFGGLAVIGNLALVIMILLGY